MSPLLKICLILILWLMRISGLQAQGAVLHIHVYSDKQALVNATLKASLNGKTAISDSSGCAVLTGLKPGSETITCSADLHRPFKIKLMLKAGDTQHLRIDMQLLQESFREFVVSGTLKTVRRSESPVPVEVYQQAYFKRNPTPNLFDALQNVNGVRPQLNCNVCNTGDIHINGLEGPYTMILIDGMPMVSSLSAVYGLSGIPNALVERLEIVKGPASSLYGSEAVGGLINVITKKPSSAPRLSADVFASSWGEFNADLGSAFKVGKKARVLNGLNLFNYSRPVDKNGDGFTDVTLQKRISLFQKWGFTRKSSKAFSLAGRYLYEDRWGGDMRWTPVFRGGDSLYAESIDTRRIELMGQYELPVREKLMLAFSYNRHLQNSYYGTMPFMAEQRIFFSQLSWDRQIGRHDLLAGATLRHTWYDDNTPATAAGDSGSRYNQIQRILLPGIFIQDEFKAHKKHRLLAGLRYDHNSVHGHIVTPRMAWKWTINPLNTIRLNAGTGFRVVNIFTEDHAALTGARTVVIRNELMPERSVNINLNLLSRLLIQKKRMLGIDLSAFYTRFQNRIIADYESDPNLIVYDNLQGYAISKGLSLNLDYNPGKRLKAVAGCTYMDVYSMNGGEKTPQILTERFSATWSATYTFIKAKLNVDYTGNLYSPMRLPLLGELDPRRPYSPWFSIQNIQLVYNGFKRWKVYGGVKNLLNWTPNRGNPFIIARSRDPFDKKVQYDGNGKVVASGENPYALSFDPNYVFGPNQGIRAFFGLTYTIP